MSESQRDVLSLAHWNDLMGKDLEWPIWQPIQPVMVEDGEVKLENLAETFHRNFSEGDTIGFRRVEQRVRLLKVEEGVTIDNSDHGLKEFPLPPDALAILPQETNFRAMLVGSGGDVGLMPMRVEEHSSDILGPRVIDEVVPPTGPDATETLVRHVVLGPDYEELTADRVAELEDLVCAEPFAHDPAAAAADGDDWTGWQTRNTLLDRPLPGDEALRERLVADVFAEQQEDGSWAGTPVTTAFRILCALSLRVPSDDERVRRAAEWLLALPEPDGRPGMWMLGHDRLAEWDSRARGETEGDRGTFMDFSEAEENLFCGEDHHQVVPNCSRGQSVFCDSMHHVSALVGEALCKAGHGDHPRLKAYEAFLPRMHSMFGYFCACWGILSPDARRPEIPHEEFRHPEDEVAVALKSIPYGFARDHDDIHVLARHSRYPGKGRPPLADTNGQPPYEWKDLGAENCCAVIGSYWQNGDCWAKGNRAMAQFPAWSGSDAEFLGLFQAHLYQTAHGVWWQAYPAGMLNWLVEVTRHSRAQSTIDDSPTLRFAKVMLLKTVPWLRLHQQDDGTWDHEGLRYDKNSQPLDQRMAAYHIITALHAFGLLDRLRPAEQRLESHPTENLDDLDAGLPSS